MFKTLIQYFVFLLLLGGISSCQPKRSDEKTTPAVDSVQHYDYAAVKDMTLYEVNIRQYTPEGTFAAFLNHLPRLDSMGIDILWIMPIQPIGQKNRKGTLGNYYAIQNYTAVNSEFGNLDDFKQLVNAAHQRGMLVLLDWVAHQTAWDHEWITKNLGYHLTNTAGNIRTSDPDWADVAKLDFNNQAMRQKMIEAMSWWVKETDIDGFRCDVAGEIPTDFWENARVQLQQIKPVFMLAEWDDPELHNGAFDMTYAWGPYQWMVEVAKENFNADSLEFHLQGDLERYPKEALRMMFITTHDENSWNGHAFKHFGPGLKAYAVLMFTVHGVPLIYSGQESSIAQSLKFYEKDTIQWGNYEYQQFYSSLTQLKKDNTALHNGVYGSRPEFLDDDNPNVITFKRGKNGGDVLVIVNLSKKEQRVQLEEYSGHRTDYFSGRKINLDQRIILQPFQFYVFSE